MRYTFTTILATLGVAALVTGSAQAQNTDQIPDQSAEVAEIEALIDGSVTPEDALVTARSQVAEGDVSGAATTLERALITDPNSIETRTYYVTLMCLLDDRMAAEYELEKLSGATIADTDWANVAEACGPTAVRPDAEQ